MPAEFAGMSHLQSLVGLVAHLYGALSPGRFSVLETSSLLQSSKLNETPAALLKRGMENLTNGMSLFTPAVHHSVVRGSRRKYLTLLQHRCRSLILNGLFSGFESAPKFLIDRTARSAYLRVVPIHKVIHTVAP